MESTNVHGEEYQQQQLEEDEASPCFSVGTHHHHHHAWRPPNFLLNNNNIHATCEEETRASNSLTNSIMIQNMGFGWANPSININLDDHQQSLVNSKKILKQESSSTSSSADHHHHHHQNSSPSTFPADMLSPSTTSSSELLLLNTLSQTYKHPMAANHELLQHQGGNYNKGVTTRFSQIFPSVNISNLSSRSNNVNNDNNNSNNNLSELGSSSSTTMEMSHEGSLDAFSMARLLSQGNNLISQGIAPSNSHLLELFKFENHHHLQQQQQSSDLKLWNKANNISSFNDNGVLESKTPSCSVEPKSAQHHQMVSKKPRLESRTSCPPFKVRKEKLGDRIAALQQLVAPFGKTDTASVLMEAIGYIKFLQNQVETLSVPYMKLSSRNKLSTNNTQRVSEGECESAEQKPDLKSRGLCLVPESCMTYLAGDACNGGVWPPPNFHHGF